MVWDLRGALLKKEERESSRLADFGFKHRVRTLRLLARRIDADEDRIVKLAARGDDQAVLTEISHTYRLSDETLRCAFTESRDEARRQLIDELGNPAPYRLL